MQQFPLGETINGDTRYNNLFPADFTVSYSKKLKTFFTNNLTAIKKSRYPIIYPYYRVRANGLIEVQKKVFFKFQPNNNNNLKLLSFNDRL
jgi:hypothetical protein